MTPPLPISVCMIVRNEERQLALAIDSVRDVAAEVIVLDTGSQDRTADIALEHGATLLRAPWRDDFAWARNLALDQARQPWVLSLDADQRLVRSTVPALSAAVQSPCAAQIVTLNLHENESALEVQGHYRALRLFRRDPRIRYRGRIHEDVAEALLDMGASEWPDSGVVLRDVGYGDPAERQRKRERNLRLLQRAQIEQPDDLFVAYKLALTLPPECADQRCDTLRRAMSLARGLPDEELHSLPFLPALVGAGVQAHALQGQLCEAVDLARHFLSVLGAQAYFTAGRALARAGCFPDANELLTRFLNRPPVGGHLALQSDPEAHPAEACHWLGWMARLSGDPRRALELLRQGLSGASPAQAMALDCEALRIPLAGSDTPRVAQALDQLAARAAGVPAALSELMLLSAELALAVGDTTGALDLAETACRSGDDRAEALIATLRMQSGAPDDLLRSLLPAVTGQRFDTLAVRAQLAQRLGQTLNMPLPQATLALLAA